MPRIILFCLLDILLIVLLYVGLRGLVPAWAFAAVALLILLGSLYLFREKYYIHIVKKYRKLDTFPIHVRVGAYYVILSAAFKMAYEQYIISKDFLSIKSYLLIIFFTWALVGVFIISKIFVEKYEDMKAETKKRQLWSKK